MSLTFVEEVRAGGMTLRSHQIVLMTVERDDLTQGVSRWNRDQELKWPSNERSG